MATKYPSALDDATTLGPTFLDVVPPADPQRNIAAEFRNNANDAVLAVQTRLGILDDTSTASVDWGMLTVSSTPNQGLRFAGSHATFPGLQAEDGIFLDSASGNPAFHKAGDPVGTFTDLTSGGGVSDWDALYGASKTMDISGTVLTWTQSAGTGVGFLVQKTSGTATDAIMSVSAANAAFPAGVAALKVVNQRLATPGLALDIDGEVKLTNHGRVYTEGTTDLTLETTGANAPITLLTSNAINTSNITINAGQSDLILTTGNLGTIDLQGAGTNGVNIAGCPLTMNLTSATWSLGGVLCQITHPGNTTSGFRMNLQGASNLTWDNGSANRIWADNSHLTIETTRNVSDLHLRSNQDAYLNVTRDVIFAARGSANISLNDAGNPIPATTNKTIIGAINELASSAVSSWNDLYALGTQMDITGSTMEFAGNTGNTAFQVSQVGAGHLLRLYDTTNTTVRLECRKSGELLTDAAVDVSGTAAFDFKNNWTTNADGMILRARDQTNFYFQIYNDGSVESKTSSSTTNPVFYLRQLASGLPEIRFDGITGADQTSTISSVQGDGSSVVGPLNKTTTVGWQFSQMIKINVNGTDAYIAAYTAAP